MTRLDWHATTILSVRRGDRVAIGGDGQVTLGTTVMKGDAVKVRRLLDGKVLVGFAGGAADGFALMERFEARLKDYPDNVPRAATELAKQWRTDRALRRLEAMLIVADAKYSLLVSGSGDVIQPSDGILSTGSGGGYALAAARALIAHTTMSAGEVVREALTIAGGIDIYTNGNLTLEELRNDAVTPVMPMGLLLRPRFRCRSVERMMRIAGWSVNLKLGTGTHFHSRLKGCDFSNVRKRRLFRCVEGSVNIMVMTTRVPAKFF